MKEETASIGAQIEKMVRERGLNITEFAKQINCVRKNVYDIFKRNSIDIELLARISKVLGHNFFEDVAQNYALALPTNIDEKEEERQRAVCQFMDVMPNVMAKHHYRGIITFSKFEDEINYPLPDFLISPFMISITIGETYEERLNGALGTLMDFKTISDDKGNTIVLCDNKYSYMQSIDIKLDYKTEEEWESLFLLALSTADKYYNETTKMEVRRAMLR